MGRNLVTFDFMSKRISVVLPQATIQAMDRMARLGERSRFNQAVQHYVVNRSTEVLRAQLERATVRDRHLDRKIAAYWFAVDQDVWQQFEEAKPQRKPTILK